MKILIADDHALFRDGLRSLLEARDHTVVAEASNGREAVVLARQLRPDLVLIDLAMPEMSGLEAIRVLSSELPELRLVVLTVSTEDRDLFEAIKAGADGYLTKDLDSDRFFSLIDGVARNEPALSPLLARKVLKELANPSDNDGPQQPDALTDRELEVLEAMVAGVTSNHELAARFEVSENTIKFHVRNIFSKLHLHNRAQVVAYALRSGMVETEQDA
jgi:DNA-binding NarL/FixJ family response regulator